MTTWRAKLHQSLGYAGETWADVEYSTLTDTQLDTSFDDGWGSEEGCPFTVWTKTRVYFPACYDGSEWVASVARNPDGKPTGHVGGG